MINRYRTMTKPFTLIQLTDMHIDATGEGYYGVDVRAQFYHALEKIKPYSPDLLVLSGDLAADQGEIEAYEWLNKQLIGFNIPYVLMSGNHDKLSIMKQVFSIADKDILADKFLCYKRDIAGYACYFLDSTPYTVSAEQLAWFSAHLQADKRPSLLFIHHPPTYCGARFLEKKYALKNAEEVWQVICTAPHLNHIFCGHYHTDMCVQKQQKNVYITPSTMAQIYTESEDFKIAHQVAGWRVIELQEGGKIESFTEYLSKVPDTLYVES